MKKIVTGPARSVAKKLVQFLPKKIQKKLFGQYWVLSAPDRVFLVEHILPMVAKRGGNILWVGCEQYTKNYPSILERAGGVCTTIEINPALSKWGSKNRHVTGDLLDLSTLLPGIMFDTVLCNGILGFGVNEPEDQKKAFKAIHAALNPEGLLLVSWNTDRTSDPIEAGYTEEYFERYAPPGLAAHYEYPTSTHVYEFLRKCT